MKTLETTPVEPLSVVRYPNNPIIRKEDVKPSSAGWQVDYVTNAACQRVGDEVLLLLRVAESPVIGPEGADHCLVSYFSEEAGRVCCMTLDRQDPSYDFSDSRVVRCLDAQGHELARYLTSISHLRIARSRDGLHFEVDDRPFMYPENEYESYGIEDPRISRIGEGYYINYTSCSPIGVTTSLARTTDWRALERLGCIFGPDNKDVCIFPRKIGGVYYALHRPTSAEFGRRDIWLAQSPDLLDWGHHQRLIASGETAWEGGRVGGSAVPIEVDAGWLLIYHAADLTDRYCLGAALLDKEDPSTVIARLPYPIMEPRTGYEREGFFGNVVFTCGALCEEGLVKLYYGAADESLCYAEILLTEVLDSLLAVGASKIEVS